MNEKYGNSFGSDLKGRLDSEPNLDFLYSGGEIGLNLTLGIYADEGKVKVEEEDHEEVLDSFDLNNVSGVDMLHDYLDQFKDFLQPVPRSEVDLGYTSSVVGFSADVVDEDEPRAVGLTAREEERANKHINNLIMMGRHSR